MKTTSLFFTLAVTTLLLTGCCSSCQSNSQIAWNNPSTSIQSTTKNPQQIALFDLDKTPRAAYRVIGVATVSRHNLLGVKRQDSAVNEMIKKAAASMGGDGVMNINTKGDTVQANVIAYEKILI